MFIMDECGRRDNGNDNPKGDDIKREIGGRTVDLALFFHCFRYGGAFAGDEETVVVMPYGVQVRRVTRSQPGSILSLAKSSGVTTLMETTLYVRVRPVESIWKRSPPFGLHAESVEFVEHEPVGQSGVSGYDGMHVLASRVTFLTASSCCLVRV